MENDQDRPKNESNLEINEDQKETDHSHNSDHNIEEQSPVKTIPDHVVNFINTINSSNDMRQTINTNCEEDVPKCACDSGNTTAKINRGQREIAGVKRKKPGRPPKSGTAKKFKPNDISTMYWGKLKNVVTLTRTLKRTNRKKKPAGKRRS